jgi:hypothetical protein
MTPNYTYVMSDLGNNRLALTFTFYNHVPPGGNLAINVLNTTYVDPNYASAANTSNSTANSTRLRNLQSSSSSGSIFHIKVDTLSVPVSEQYNFDNATLASIATTGSATNSAGTGTQVATGVTAVVSSQSSSTSHTMINFQLFTSVRYMGINFPPNLQIFFSTLPNTAVSLDFMPDVTAQGSTALGGEVVLLAPVPFARYNISPYFVVNFGATISTYIIIVGVLLLIFPLERLIPKVPASVGGILQKLVYFVKWNYLLTFTLSNYQNVVMFWLLQWVSMEGVDNELQILSICLTVFFTVVLFTPVITFLITNKVFAGIEEEKKTKLYEIKVDSSSARSPVTNWQQEQALSPEPAKAVAVVAKPEPPKIPEQFSSLYGGVKYNKKMSLMYMTVCTVRGLFHFLFIAVLTNYPFAQALLITINNLSMMVYMKVARPPDTVINYVKLFGNEYILLVTYLLALILAGHDYAGDTDIDRRMAIGNGIIVMNVIFYYWSLVFQVLDALWSIWVIIKGKLDERKNAAKEAKNKEEEKGKGQKAKEEIDTQLISPEQVKEDNSHCQLRSLTSNNDNADIPNEEKGKISIDYNSGKLYNKMNKGQDTENALDNNSQQTEVGRKYFDNTNVH